MSLGRSIIVSAIELDIVHALGVDEIRHPSCLGTHCYNCTIGIKINAKEVNAKKCPLCGANYISNIYDSCPYSGTVNSKYECGTVINICGRDLGISYSYSVTSIFIGSKCRGIDNMEDII